MSVWGFLNRQWAGWSRNGKFHSQQEQNSELRIKNNVYCSTYLSEWDIVPAIHHVWFLQRRNIWSLHLSCHFVIMSEVCSFEVLQWPTEVKIATCKIWAEWSFNKLCSSLLGCYFWWNFGRQHFPSVPGLWQQRMHTTFTQHCRSCRKPRYTDRFRHRTCGFFSMGIIQAIYRWDICLGHG